MDHIQKYFSAILIRSSLFLILISIAFFDCSTSSSEKPSAKFKIGLIFGEGGKDDLSFNSNAWKGAVKARDEFDLELNDVETGYPSMIEPAVRTFAEQNYDLIIGVGFAIKNAIEKVAPQFPDKYFVIIDTNVDQPNVASLIFEENEASFLVGIIAAEISKNKIVGFVGGMKIPLIERAYRSYEAGVKYADSNVRVIENYAGVTINAFSDPAKGKELALAQISQGADIIYQTAGATGMGVFNAAVEQKILAIGSDSNQNGLRPGFILTSMLKNLDVALYDFIKTTLNTSFKPGIHLYNLANNGVGYSIDDNNRSLIPKHVIDNVEKAKADIINGKIKVPDYK